MSTLWMRRLPLLLSSCCRWECMAAASAALGETGDVGVCMRVLSGNGLEPSGKCVFSLVVVSWGTLDIWEHALIRWGL